MGWEKSPDLFQSIGTGLLTQPSSFVPQGWEGSDARL